MGDPQDHTTPRERPAAQNGVTTNRSERYAVSRDIDAISVAAPRRHDTAPKSRTLVVAIAIVSLAIVGVAGFGVHLIAGGDTDAKANPNGLPGFVVNETSGTEKEEEPPLPSKLEGATETIDENGIVHGTTPGGISYTVRGRGVSGAQADRVTLAAVGDQIGTDNSLPLADRYAGSVGDGVYNFVPFYQEVASFIQEHDLRYINQETVMAGNENGYAYSGYPLFNTPDAAADAIAEVGFNLVNFATNHIYDMGSAGIERSHEVWDRYPELLVAGSYPTAEERDTVHMIERNGTTFAFLAYTYGDNSYLDPANMPNDYYLRTFDKNTIRADVERAQQVADAVIVSMHWGTEYTTALDDQQLDYAQFLADLNVDLVLGTHAHIMQPTRLYTAADGSTVPVVFGLSDFVSGWTLVDTILSGIFTCDFVRNDAGEIEAENAVWHPTIEWSNGDGSVYVRFLKGMDEAEMNANTRTDDTANDYAYLRNMIDSMGMEIPVDW